MSTLNIIKLDNFDNEIEEITINKPKTYQELLEYLNNKNILYEIFIYDDNNNKILINDEILYKTIQEILFIKERKNLVQSLFSINYEKLSESKREILNEKYNCNICSFIIKNENPYLCYNCQKIFHEKCLKEWDDECKLHYKILECPVCRNKLPLIKWNKKLNYEDNRIDNANLLNEINKYKNMNNYKNIIIKDKKIKEYENFINKTIIIFRNILNKINIISNNMKKETNNKLIELINNNNLNINDISNIINEELDKINEYISNNKINNENINNSKISEYKNEINLIYCAKNKSKCKLFGYDFVNNNKDNIELIINGKKNNIVNEYELKEGENIITLIIKNKLTNLSYMFNKCSNLQDINDLKYLNVNDVEDFSFMFYECTSLSNIKSLQNWNVSNVTNFSGMFS